MKTLPLLLLLFLGGLVFYGCKKSKPTVHEPDMVVKQDSFQHIVDSLKFVKYIDSLGPWLAGNYLVSGSYVTGGVHGSQTTIFNNDTLKVTWNDSSYLTAIFNGRDSVTNTPFTFFISPPLYSDTIRSMPYPDRSRYYAFSFSGSVDCCLELYLLFFPKNNLDSVYMSWDTPASGTGLSGVKIH